MSCISISILFALCITAVISVSNHEIEQFVTTHNFFREQVCVGALEWDSEVASVAQGWADTCPGVTGGSPHDGSPAKPLSYGENVFAGTGDSWSAEESVDMWVNGWGTIIPSEIDNYNCETNECTPGVQCGHYTQVVWESSTKVGCGIKYGCPGASWSGGRDVMVIVCHYSSAGNWVGMRPFPVDQCSNCETQTAPKSPTQSPTQPPTKAPTKAPTKTPTKAPTKTPTKAPTKAPTRSPTSGPTNPPTARRTRFSGSNDYAVEAPKISNGVVADVSSSWKTVSLPHRYKSMVVVATPMYSDPTTSGVVRVRTVDQYRFQMRVDSVCGTNVPITGVSVSYMVAEEGSYTVEKHGIKMEAHTLYSRRTAYRYYWGANAASYSNHYTKPVVIGQVMSYNDVDWSVFWSTGSRMRTAPSTLSLRVGKHVGENIFNPYRSAETLGYIIIESGSGTVDGARYEASVGADLIQGIGSTGNSARYAVEMTNPGTVIATMTGLDSRDGGWAVIRQDPRTSDGYLYLAIDEDICYDDEKSHPTEQVAYVIFENTSAKRSWQENVQSDVNYVIGSEDGDIVMIPFPAEQE